jgi:hypothetical protein
MAVAALLVIIAGAALTPCAAEDLGERVDAFKKQADQTSCSLERMVVQPSMGVYSLRDGAVYQWTGGDSWNPAFFQTREFFANGEFAMSFEIFPVPEQGGPFHLRFCAPGKTTYIWTFDWPGLTEGRWYRVDISNASASHSITVVDLETGEVAWENRDLPHDAKEYGLFQFIVEANRGCLYRNINLPAPLVDTFEKPDELFHIMYPDVKDNLVPMKPFIAESAVKESIVQAIEQRRAGVAPDGSGPYTSQREIPGATIDESENYWRLHNQEFDIYVEKAAGSVNRVVGLQPSELEIMPLTRQGLVLYAWNKDANWWTLFDVVKSVEVEPAVEDGSPCVTLTLSLAPSDHAAQGKFEAKARWIVCRDYVVSRVQIESLEQNSDTYEFAYLQAYEAGSWEKQITTHHMGEHYVRAPETRAVHRYQDELWDRTRAGWQQRCRYPIGIMERDDRFWLWGGLDLNGFAVLTTNVAGSMPGFTLKPAQVEQDQTFNYECVFKTFAKPQQTFYDVSLWYGQHVYSTHPLSKGLVAIPRDSKPHTLPPGNIAFHCYSREWIAPKYYDPAFFDQFYSNLDRMQATHIWYTYWWKWDYTYPTEGQWINETNNTISADSLKRELKWLKYNGYRPYFYFRQLWNLAGTYDDQAPYRSWVMKDKYGQYKWFFGMRGEMDSRRKELLNIPLDQFVIDGPVCMNFDNREFLDWFIGRIKTMVETYDPAGVCWDMGWGDIWYGACSVEPTNPGMHHGETYVMATIYKWLKAEHPDKYVIMNANTASPSQLWCDAVMFENSMHSVDPYALQAAKAYGTVIGNFNYAESYQSSDPQWRIVHKQAMMRTLAQGVGSHTRGYNSFPYDGPMTKDSSGYIWAHQGGEHLPAMEDFFAFSAQTYATPLVAETDAVLAITDSEEVAAERVVEVAQYDYLTGITAVKEGRAQDLLAASWASEEQYLLAVFNDYNTEKKFRVLINRPGLAAYGNALEGEFTFTVLGPDGLLKSRTWEHAQVSSEDYLILEGSLGPKEELLAVNTRGAE